MNLTETQLREFLLRRMPAADSALLEEAILVEDGVAERLRAEELDLIDDYATDQLSGEDRADVERHLLTSIDNIRSLRTTRLLNRVSALHLAPRPALRDEPKQDGRQPDGRKQDGRKQDGRKQDGRKQDGRKQDQPKQDRPEQDETKRDESKRLLVTSAEAVRVRRWTGRIAGAKPLLAAGLAAALVAGLVSAVWMPYWHGASRGRVMTPPTVAHSAVSQSSPARPPIAAVDPLPILTLLADVNRGSMQPSLHWTAAATSVRLQAEVTGPEDALYTLRVANSAGHRLFEVAALPAHSAGRYRFVDTVVPAAALGPGARVISLLRSGAADGTPADYTWHVVGVPD